MHSSQLVALSPSARPTWHAAPPPNRHLRPRHAALQERVLLRDPTWGAGKDTALARVDDACNSQLATATAGTGGRATVSAAASTPCLASAGRPTTRVTHFSGVQNQPRKEIRGCDRSGRRNYGERGFR
ncbi:hypothetical protein DL764_004987 [Monosporascus ibericus]|uniref:Uncharacterized protein n=1 Tax=Monosporascus ibericus TaxID=155417 RepID=A0A4Q4TDW3_9PEZI|nr:hypothetical protein DL764_004987 [Monosporascus ibericus]